MAEQRYQAVRAVISDGRTVTEVAAAVAVSLSGKPHHDHDISFLITRRPLLAGHPPEPLAPSQAPN